MVPNGAHNGLKVSDMRLERKVIDTPIGKAVSAFVIAYQRMLSSVLNQKYIVLSGCV